MDFSCSSHTAEKFIKLCEDLTKSGYAVKVHDSVTKDGKVDKSGFSTAKYLLGYDYREVDFDINVKVHPDTSNFQFSTVSKAPVRFWIERRRGNGGEDLPYERRAGIKITDEGFMLLLKSMTVIGLLQKVGFKIAKGGAIDLDSIIQRLNGILQQVDGEKSVEKP